MLPTCDVGKCSETGKPLGHFVNVVAVLFEKLETRSSIKQTSIVNLIVPFDFEGHFLAGREWIAQIDAHHGVDDCRR